MRVFAPSFLVCAALCLCGSAGARADIGVSVGAEDGTLYVDARAPGFLGEGLESALRSGLPAQLMVELALWEQRAGVWDRRVTREDWKVHIVYDLLEEGFEVLDSGGEVLMESTDFVAVEDFAGAVELWPLAEVEELDSLRTYYVTVQYSVEPLSVEEVRELERWLRGGPQGARRRLSDVPGRLVGFLRASLGLGGHRDVGRSAGFLPGALAPPE